VVNMASSPEDSTLVSSPMIDLSRFVPTHSFCIGAFKTVKESLK